MENRPLVSVLMSSYNHAEYVGKAIQSVLNQAYQKFEFIIVDDGSDDATPDIIQQYKDTRIDYKRFEQNTGFEAFGYLYQKAKGKYMAFIDSDDMWDSRLLEVYVDFMEKNEDYGCCFCLPKIIDETDHEIDWEESPFIAEEHTPAEWFRKLYTSGNCICGPSMCIRRFICEQLGEFRFQYRQVHDYEYWLRLIQKTNIYIFPENLVLYRQHREGKNQNISTPTLEVQRRDMTERKYIMYDIMENVDAGFFVESFKEDFIYRPDDWRFNLDCEKMGIMFQAKAVPLEAAIFFCFKHFCDNNFTECLEKNYGYRKSDFWKITGAEQKSIDSTNSMYRMIVSLRRELEQKERELKVLQEKVADRGREK